MSDDTIVPSPLLDRQRVAEAIQCRVRLEIHPTYAKAAAHGMPVELTEEQSLAVADAALAALVAAHPISGKAWLIKANEDWQRRNASDQLRWRAILARQRRAIDTWRAMALNGYVVAVTGFAAVRWHLPGRAILGLLMAGSLAGIGLRWWLLRRDKRKADAR